VAGGAMTTIFENVYDVIFQPRTAFRRLAADRPFRQAGMVFFLSVLIPAAPLYFTMNFAAGLIMGLQLIGGLLVWFFSAAVWGLAAEFFGGVGRSSSLFLALGFTHMPRILLVPGLVVASIMPSAIKTVWEVLLVAGVFFWTLLLDIIAIRETYALSGAKAALVVILPLLIMLIILIIAAISTGIIMAEMPFSLGNVLVE
jgi:hypothetical protein